MNYWLVKSEPFKYSWDNFKEAGLAVWDGVRNYQARNNLKAMQLNDLVLFYHSNEGKEVVGIAKISREHYPDPTADSDAWVVVELVPVQDLNKSISLKMIKEEPELEGIALVKQSRLSVIALDKREFDKIVEMSNS